MAARQDQTLQIALIVFAILLVGFAGFTYWFYKQSSDAHQRIAGLENDISTANTAVRNKEIENESLRQFMGFQQSQQFNEVEEQFKKDMERMGATLPEPKRRYREVLEVIYAENQTLARAQAVDKDKIKDLETKLQEVEAGHQAQIAQLEAQIAKIAQDAAADRNRFEAARAELDANKKRLAEQLTAQTEQFDKERAGLTDRIASLQGEVQTRQRTIDKLLSERQHEDFSFEVADGQIRWVNQADNTVWINLGAADALQRQVNFSVHDASETDAGKAQEKGAIEVIRILGEHMAEARVTDDDPRNPIMPGDFIYSPVWNRGRPTRFAFTGLVDLDGDGRNDMHLAKDLVTMNGGVVDAWPNPETGVQEGEMSVETRYLVYGERSDRTNDANLRQTWDEMHDRANALGVDLISLTAFINKMGYKPEDRTVNLGTGVRADDFRPRPNVERGDLRPRSPYSRP